MNSKLNFSKVVFALLISFLFTSCGSVYYAPNSHNVPLFKQKGDAKLSAAISAGEDVEKAFELQSAYAITDHIGLMANLYRVKQGEDQGTLVELGGGYFQTFQEHVVFEAYGGVSYAQVTNINSSNTEYTDFTRYFIQPAIGYSRNAFEIALSSRFAILNYHRIESPNLTAPISADLAHLMVNKVQYLFEPALTIRGGWKYVKFQTQLGFSKSLLDESFDQDHLNLSFGIYFSVSELYKN